MRAAFAGAVVRRAFITSVVVGTLLTVINHADYLFELRFEQHLILPVLLTYLIPYVVSTVSSVAANRGSSPGNAAAHADADRDIELLSHVPGQNPNPVLRMRRDGTLVYANASSQQLREALGADIGHPIPEPVLGQLLDAAAAGQNRAVEVAGGVRTFSVLPIAVPEAGLVNLYGTDVTAAKVVERFPERNPNPVMRMSPEGTLLYANRASAPIARALRLDVGDPLPPDIREACLRSLHEPDVPPFEVMGEGRTFAFKPVHVPEFDFINLYGTDVTALKALDKFPDRNPNPVLRVSRGGQLTYANPASTPIRQALGAGVGLPLPKEFFDRVLTALEADEPAVLEVTVGERTFELLVVSLFEFDSINLYGTEVTAARAVAAANRENERLLLNILPRSIADRLRSGELVIADRFDEMTVMFADCVRFTELSSALSPTELVQLLNEVFSVFDRLADRYGLEKIKTVGDAYMVVGGLTGADGGPRHDARVADMALDVMESLAHFRTPFGQPVQVRIGIHCGPTVAGVIGLKKFIYDVWGDAVNIASRMESQGIPGRIQVSAPTYDRLAADFTFEPRGWVEIKGKGALETYFLTGRRRPAQLPVTTSGSPHPSG